MSDTQVIELNEGWNWISFHIIKNDMNINNYLNSISWVNGDLIKTQSYQSDFNVAWNTSSGISHIDVNKMYKIKCIPTSSRTFPIILSITGINNSQNSHPSMSSGWNWISHPHNTNENVDSIFTNTSENDILKSQKQFTIVKQNTWIPYGNLTTLESNVGYKYFLNAEKIPNDSLQIFNRTFNTENDSIYPLSISSSIEDISYTITNNGLSSKDSSYIYELPSFLINDTVDDLYLKITLLDNELSSCTVSDGDTITLNCQSIENIFKIQYFNRTSYNSSEKTNIFLSNINNLVKIELYNKPSNNVTFTNNVTGIYTLNDNQFENNLLDLNTRQCNLVSNYKYIYTVSNESENITLNNNKLLLDSMNNASFSIDSNGYMYFESNASIFQTKNGHLYSYLVHQHIDEEPFNVISIHENNNELPINDKGNTVNMYTHKLQDNLYIAYCCSLYDDKLIVNIKSTNNKGNVSIPNTKLDNTYDFIGILPQYFKIFIRSNNFNQNIITTSNDYNVSSSGHSLSFDRLTLKCKPIEVNLGYNLSLYDTTDNLFKLIFNDPTSNVIDSDNSYPGPYKKLLRDNFEYVFNPTTLDEFKTLNNFNDENNGFDLFNQIMKGYSYDRFPSSTYGDELIFQLQINFTYNYVINTSNNLIEISDQPTENRLQSIDDIIQYIETLNSSNLKETVLNNFLNNTAVFNVFFDNPNNAANNIGHNYDSIFKDTLIQNRHYYKFPSDLYLISRGFNPSKQSQNITNIDDFFTGLKQFNDNSYDDRECYKLTSRIVFNNFDIDNVSNINTEYNIQINNEQFIHTNDTFSSVINDNIIFNNGFQLKLKLNQLNCNANFNVTNNSSLNIFEQSGYDPLLTNISAKLKWPAFTFETKYRLYSELEFSSDINHLAIYKSDTIEIDGQNIEYNKSIYRQLFSSNLADSLNGIYRTVTYPQISNIIDNQSSININFNGPHFKTNFETNTGQYSLILSYTDLLNIYDFNNTLEIDTIIDNQDNTNDDENQLIFYDIKNIGQLLLLIPDNLSKIERESFIKTTLLNEVINIYVNGTESDIVELISKNKYTFYKINKNNSIYNEDSLLIHFTDITFSTHNLQSISKTTLHEHIFNNNVYSITNITSNSLRLSINVQNITNNINTNGQIKCGQIKFNNINIVDVIPDTFIEKYNSIYDPIYNQLFNIFQNEEMAKSSTDASLIHNDEFNSFTSLKDNTFHNSNTIYFIDLSINGFSIVDYAESFHFTIHFSSINHASIDNALLIDSNDTNSGSGFKYTTPLHKRLLNDPINHNDTSQFIVKSDSPYKVKINMSGVYSINDYNIIEYAVNTWRNIITERMNSDSEYDMIINVEFLEMDYNILGYAGPTNSLVNADGKYIPIEGSMAFNTLYWNTNNRQTGLSEAYYTVLHEIGHIFGIGTLWFNHNLVTDDSLWYTGTHALQQYRNINNNQTLTAIPIEDDGGAGTAGGHPEEGNNPRYNDGQLHPGLDHELMTGFAELSGNEPLSAITIGFLEDLGYKVNYDYAEEYSI